MHLAKIVKKPYVAKVLARCWEMASIRDGKRKTTDVQAAIPDAGF